MKANFFCAPSLHSDNYFSLRVAFLEISDRVWNFAQRFIRSVDDGLQFSRLHHFGEEREVLGARLRHHHAHFLFNEMRIQCRVQRFTKCSKKALLVRSTAADPKGNAIWRYNTPAVGY